MQIISNIFNLIVDDESDTDDSDDGYDDRFLGSFFVRAKPTCLNKCTYIL